MDRDNDTKYQNLFSRIFEERIVLSERQAYLCTSSEQKDDSKSILRCFPKRREKQTEGQAKKSTG